MVLILSRNATSIHSLLVDGASPAYQCTFACTLHLHTRPLSVGRRQEPRAQTPSSSTVDEYFLPSSLSLSSRISSKRQRRSTLVAILLDRRTKREREMGDKKRQGQRTNTRSDLDPLWEDPFRFLSERSKDDDEGNPETATPLPR